MFSIWDVFAMTPTYVLIEFWLSVTVTGLGFICCLGNAIEKRSFRFEDEYDFLRVIALFLFIFLLAASLYLPFSDQKDHNKKYVQLLASDTQTVYSETDLMKLYDVLRAKGSYKVDTSKMTKEVYMQCIHDSVNLYDIIIVPN